MGYSSATCGVTAHGMHSFVITGNNGMPRVLPAMAQMMDSRPVVAALSMCIV